MFIDVSLSRKRFSLFVFVARRHPPQGSPRGNPAEDLGAPRRARMRP
jgi:hypothetical protein